MVLLVINSSVWLSILFFFGVLPNFYVKFLTVPTPTNGDQPPLVTHPNPANIPAGWLGPIHPRSTCSKSCGGGFQQRSRHTLRESKLGALAMDVGWPSDSEFRVFRGEGCFFLKKKVCIIGKGLSLELLV